MWKSNLSASDKSTNEDVSISETTEKDNKIHLTDNSDKNQGESGVDSGFLSGPQLLEEECCDIDEDIAPLKSEIRKDNKDIAHHSTVVEKEYLDSGCIEEDDDFPTSAPLFNKKQQKENKEGHMILESGVDSGLTEWFCNLSLKNSNQPLNNLGGSSVHPNSAASKKSSKDTNVTALLKDNKNRQSWEIYYQQNNEGDTQMHLACMTGHVNVVSALIRMAPHPCLFDIQNDEAQSALHLAVLTSQPKIIRMLLVAGAEPISRDRNGNTPLHLACVSGDLQCVKALTIPISASEMQEAHRQYGIRSTDRTTSIIRCAQLPPDLEIKNYDGERCVHLAAQTSQIEVLRHLVWFGADINAREGKSGRTPLHIAIESRNEILANFLLEECQKLNLETATYAGLTAYQIACILNNHQMQNNLEKRGAETLTPPDSDIDTSDIETDLDDSQLYDRFGDPGFFVSAHNGGTTINVA